MRFELVIFDVGRVLVGYEPHRFFKQLAGALRRPIEQVQEQFNDPKLIEPFERGQLQPKQFFEQLQKSLRLPWTYEQFVDAWNGMLSENTQTTWLIDRLRARYKLSSLTNTNVLHDDYIRRTWPVFSQLHYWVASYQVGWRKPELQIYEFVLRQAGVDPQAAVYVDDVKEFVEAAGRLGLATIHFRDGVKLEEELRALGLHI